MTRAVIGLIVLTPLLIVQACSTPKAPLEEQLRHVTIRVEGMAENNGVL